MSINSRAGRLILTLFILCILGCGESDPYDPIIGGPQLGPGARKGLETVDFLSDEEKKVFISGGSIGSEKLLLLSDLDVKEIRHLVASNPMVTDAMLIKLARDPVAGVRRAVAVSKKANENILSILIKDKVIQVIRDAVSNPNWSEHQLEAMYASEFEIISLAKNPSLPAHILEGIVDDEYQFSSAAVASNSNISLQLARRLWAFNNKLINKNLCLNQSAGADVLNLLIENDDVFVRDCATKTLFEIQK